MISVIVSVFNIKPCLRKCTDCMIRQTYRVLESSVIDDDRSKNH